MEWILVIHVMTTLYMMGICWFVQIVHYPLFSSISQNDFPSYQQKNWVTGNVTGPFMVIELVTGGILLYHFQDLYFLINLALIGVTGFSTILIQIPIHLKLKKESSNSLITKLVRTNWIRTISWTLRVIILSFLLTQFIDI